MDYCDANHTGLPAPTTAIYSRHAKQMLGSQLTFDVAEGRYSGRRLANVILRIAYVDSDTTPFTVTFATQPGATPQERTINRTGRACGNGQPSPCPSSTPAICSPVGRCDNQLHRNRQ
ncbi:MAG: hypothetical protein HZY76_09975 [Anaerolineae bacterium]|nr:MAG: hypothetical protein HZY76_09975 [Anaerolineae bacterium]